MKIPNSKKYEIIREMTEKEDNLLNVVWLCEAAGVSRSSYYHYLNTEVERTAREEQDLEDFCKILDAFQYRGFAKGARSIHMRLLHMNPPVVMNIKKIRRLMRKYDLRCPVRKPNPYKQQKREIVTAATSPNLLNREFETRGPRAVLLTDITYIINGKAPRCYMSTIIDACTKELLAWTLSENLKMDFVIDSLNILIHEHGSSLAPDAIVHSDQGSHYRSIMFSNLLKDHELRQSMSRKANCWDNAPQESFFGHMKDEIDISECTTFDEIYSVISDWTDYYNSDRYQWDLAKLSPKEYYTYLKTGKYPLKKALPRRCDQFR